MNARSFLPSLMMLPLLLSACATRPAPAPVAVVPTKASEAAGRRAEIKRQISAVCPVLLTTAELNRLADVVQRYPADADVRAIVARQDRMDDETAICRGKAR